MKRLMIFLISILAVITIIVLLLWGLIVPKVVIPKIREYIDVNFNGQVKLVIKDISYNIFSGFALQDVELKGPVILKDDRILCIDIVDIDLALLPLLRRRIEVSRFEMDGVSLTVGRDTNGSWNYQPLLELDMLKEKEAGKYRFLINEFVIRKGKLNYFDYLNKENMLERQFENVDLFLRKLGGESYRLYLSGNASQKSDESINLELDFNILEKYTSGFVRLNTKHLSEYWHYYLDDMLNPWNLKAEDVVLNMGFSYINDILTLNGGYGISNGIISYGDLHIRGNGVVKQNIKYVRGIPGKDVARIDLSLDNISSSTGEHTFLDRGKCTAVITEKEVAVERLTGVIKRQPVSLSGNFTFGEPRGLFLTGKIANIDNNFNLKLLSDNQGMLDWIISVGSSNAELHADISDLKNIIVDLNLAGLIKIPDLSELLKINKEKIEGTVNISGNIKGELDKVSTLQGGINVGIQGFSIWDLEPLVLNFNMDFTNGILEGEIPKIDYYKGKLYGDVKMDYNNWGVELNLEKFDISEFVKTQPKFKGMRGLLTGKIACVSSLGDFGSLRGGGYLKAVKCDLWNAPIFSDTEKGIESIITEVEMPVLKSVEVYYGIGDEKIVIENAFCDAQSMDLNMTGNISFSGMVDITVGTKLIGKGLFKIAKNILVPVTIGIDAVVDCIQVKITGQWPNLTYHAQIQPMRWLNWLFSGLGTADPDKYSLVKLWES